ncbi:MAG: hypothetical protein MUC93_02085 [Bacteroidales bacterium]|jgi:hypothetical protein|nr:hypothetical protein [Bacteroidales bacterium]
MKKILLWLLAFVITICAAYYQRKTGPTYPKSIEVTLNDSLYKLKLIRSIGLDEPSEVKLHIKDTSVKAILYFKRFRSDDNYQSVLFQFKTYPVNSYVMNRIFKMTEEKGLFADIPPQPPAGKLQYYVELTDSKGIRTIMKETPVVIRFKGGVPGYILGPHILIMFITMLFSTGAGLLAFAGVPSYKKYATWTLILLTAGGMVLGPLVQKYAFGDLWTGIPFGWDLTDNKTLIAMVFWVLAVIMNRIKERPLYTVLAAFILLLVYSIPHSMFGSELDYSTGQVTQGIISIFFLTNQKNS